MDLDNGVLTKSDRRILATLGRDATYRIVRVPLSEATWSTWKRYCGTLRVSMGRAIAGLIGHELGAIVMPDMDGGAAFAAELRQQLVEQSKNLDARKDRLDERERSLSSIRAPAASLECPTRIVSRCQARSERALSV